MNEQTIAKIEALQKDDADNYEYGYNAALKDVLRILKEPSRLQELRQQLADEAAQNRIACLCYRNDHEWIDCSGIEDTSFDDAVEYADSRNLIEHHPEHADWIRIKE